MQKYTDRNVGGPGNKLSKRAITGIAVLVCSVFFLICLVFNFLPFIRSFILGTFGMATYPVLVVALIIGALLLTNRKYIIAKNYIICICVLYFLLICVSQTALTEMDYIGMGEYLSDTYTSKNTAGGVIAGIFAYGFSVLFGYTGAYILFAIGAIICVAFMIDYFLKMSDYRKLNARAVSYPIEKGNMRTQEEIVNTEQQKSKKQSLMESMKKQAGESLALGLNSNNELVTVGSKHSSDNMANQVFGGDYQSLVNKTQPHTQQREEAFSLDEFVNKTNNSSFEPRSFQTDTQYTPSGYQNTEVNFNKSNNVDKFNFEPLDEKVNESINVEQHSKAESESIINNFSKMIGETPNPVQTNNTLSYEIKPREHEQKTTQLEMQQTKPTPNPTTTYKRPSPYVRPPVSLLTTQSSKQDGNEADFKQRAHVLEETLDSFKISATVVGITRGPAVTRYEIQMPAGISVKKISQHSDDIAMMMKSYGGVRIEAPIPGKNLVGIEIPNEKIATIGLNDIVNSPEFHNSKSPLTVALGKDIAGTIKVCDLAAMPHLLVAGATGSGKSVCLNVILISLIYKLGIDDLRLILIDPKRVEFTSYNGLPHLLTPEVICQPKQALSAFDWAIKEMDDRFDTFQRLKVRDINEYNSLEAVYKGREPKLPRIVIVVDELADLMMMARKELEEKIMRIAQLSRAAGIHLILATQRPSVNVITGTIKANLPSRIAFAVNNFADSNTIINQGGAEKLLGRGDMLYAPQNLPEPVRIQCPFITNTEVLNIVDFIKNNNDSDFDDQRTKQILEGKGTNHNGGDDDGSDAERGDEFDPILPKALLEFIRAGTGSISAIQRRYSVGYARAARIVDQMERHGFISTPDPTNKNRQILIDEARYNELFSDGQL